MKSILTALLLAVCASTAFAQETLQTILSRGKDYFGNGIHIHDNYFSNLSLLSEGYKGVRLGYNNVNGNGMIMPVEGQGSGFDIATYYNSILSTKFTVLNSGNVGIGYPGTLSNTGNKGLQIAKGGHSSIILGDPMNDGKGGIIQASDDRHRLFIGANLYDDELNNWKNFQSGKGGAGISIVADEGNWGSFVEFYVRKQDGLGNDYSKMHINADGNVGIGTTTPKEKLSVNGKIRAHEVKVETANWPDYVFEEGYDVVTLEKLESYIKTNKHLPEVPSAKEAEANGVELGEMNKILLKKIEELTLLLIEQNKRIEKLEKNEK